MRLGHSCILETEDVCSFLSFSSISQKSMYALNENAVLCDLHELN